MQDDGWVSLGKMQNREKQRQKIFSSGQQCLQPVQVPGIS